MSHSCNVALVSLVSQLPAQVIKSPFWTRTLRGQNGLSRECDKLMVFLSVQM
jgi:hypothetical protein